MRREKGQVLVLYALALFVLIGMAALGTDVGLLFWRRAQLQSSVDAAVLAGAMELPTDGLNAQGFALQYLRANDSSFNLPMRNGNQVSLTFRCMVGDRNGDGLPDAADVPAVCDPGVKAFTCVNGFCYSQCDFNAGDTCNTIVADASEDVPFNFGPAIGIPLGNTGIIRGAACRGACGGAPTAPLDVVVVIDRTGSMGTTDLNNAKEGAKGVLELYNPNFQQVGLGVLGPSRGGASGRDRCSAARGGGNWVPVDLSTDYQQNDGTLNGASPLVETVGCLNNSSVGTNLGQPMREAARHLELNGRPGVKGGIIFMTDGAANRGAADPCLFAFNEAQKAKAKGIEIFIIGFGIEDSRCSRDGRGSPYRSAPVTQLLADMATDSLDDWGSCRTPAAIAAENADGDHFLCETRGAELKPVFVTAAEVLAGGVKLVAVPN